MPVKFICALPYSRTMALKRNIDKQKLRHAAMRAQSMGAPEAIRHRPPDLLPGVVPPGRAAPVLAMDNAGEIPFSAFFPQMHMAGASINQQQIFPGYQYLAHLATRSEFRALAESLSVELTRKWIEMTSTDEASEKIKAIDEELTKLNVRGLFQLAATHDSYFGRGQFYIDIEGADRNLPLILDPRTVRPGSLKRVAVIEPIWTTPSMYNALDPAAPDFYKPSKWFVLGRETHASRLLTVTTRPLPDILKPAFNFSGMSLSQLAEPYVDNWLRTRQSVSDLINNFSITALKTSMDQILQGGDDDDGDSLFKRADLFTAMRSNRGLMLLDKDREELVQINTPLGGLHELQAQAQEQLCSVGRIPAVILTGISPSGLNASSDGEIRVFYDWIAAQQEAYWRDPLEIIIKTVQLSLFGEIDPSISFKFVPLYQMSAAEEADIRLKNAQTATAYVDMGVLDPAEERERIARDPESGYEGLELIDVPDPELETMDKSVSEAQRRAMQAAAHGHSTLGIPKSVGKEFAEKDAT